MAKSVGVKLIKGLKWDMLRLAFKEVNLLVIRVQILLDDTGRHGFIGCPCRVTQQRLRCGSTKGPKRLLRLLITLIVRRTAQTSLGGRHAKSLMLALQVA